MGATADAARALPTEAEIGVLEALVAQGEVLSARIDALSPLLRTRLLFVDPHREFLVVSPEVDPAAEDRLLGLDEISFFVEWGQWRIAFAGSRPQPALHDGADAVRLRFPEQVAIGRRRMHERVPVPAESMRCVAGSGAGNAFEATVTDISAGGVGLQVEARSVAIEPGMVFRGCRIERRAGEGQVVDLEIRHTAVTRAPDGRSLLRMGCRFVNPATGSGQPPPAR